MEHYVSEVSVLGKLKALQLLSPCDHQFCWPRRTEDGEYYQACVLCGQEYAYDWAKMQRTRKLRGVRRNPKHSWRPRGRRLACALPVQFRLNGGSSEWSTGTSVNLSRWGMLLRVPVELQVESELTLRFELPAGLLGSEAADIVALARVLRSRRDEHGLAVALRFVTSLTVHGPGAPSSAINEPR